jgi:hypothetical protein
MDRESYTKIQEKLPLKNYGSWAPVAYECNPSTWKAEMGKITV